MKTLQYSYLTPSLQTTTPTGRARQSEQGLELNITSKVPESETQATAVVSAPPLPSRHLFYKPTAQSLHHNAVPDPSPPTPLQTRPAHRPALCQNANLHRRTPSAHKHALSPRCTASLFLTSSHQSDPHSRLVTPRQPHRHCRCPHPPRLEPRTTWRAVLHGAEAAGVIVIAGRSAECHVK